MKRENRLKKNKQFNFIYKHGEARHTAYLSLVFAKTKVQPFKCGFSVSKKVGKSVIRSKVKRHLRESFSFYFSHFKPTNNYIFVAHEGISNLSLLEVEAIMKTLLMKANCYVD